MTFLQEKKRKKEKSRQDKEKRLKERNGGK